METTFSKDNNPCKNYIAFFDLDRTIISANSSRSLIKYAFKKGLITTKDLIKGFYLSLLYRLDLRDPLKIINTMVNWVEGVPKSSMEELSAEIFKDSICHSIRPEVQSEINFHKSHGARVVILSSAILPICSSAADYLGMDDIICSDLEVIDGVYTGRPVGKLCFREEKVVRLIEYCKKNGTTTGCSWYYGDSIADLPVLSVVGNPVCVNPDKKLRKAALKKGWRILLRQ